MNEFDQDDFDALEREVRELKDRVNELEYGIAAAISEIEYGWFSDAREKLQKLVPKPKMTREDALASLTPEVRKALGL